MNTQENSTVDLNKLQNLLQSLAGSVGIKQLETLGNLEHLNRIRQFNEDKARAAHVELFQNDQARKILQKEFNPPATQIGDNQYNLHIPQNPEPPTPPPIPLAPTPVNGSWLKPLLWGVGGSLWIAPLALLAYSLLSTPEQPTPPPTPTAITPGDKSNTTINLNSKSLRIEPLDH